MKKILMYNKPSMYDEYKQSLYVGEEIPPLGYLMIKQVISLNGGQIRFINNGYIPDVFEERGRRVELCKIPI